MPSVLDPAVAGPTVTTILRIALATALGLFLGLEREWSEKPAGIRTFALTSLLGAIVTLSGAAVLLALGGVLVIVLAAVMAVAGLRADGDLSLTTSVSLLVAYGIGVLVASGAILEGVAVAVISAFLLVLKRELHSFAWGLTREELRAVVEFAILAFVVLPLLPAEHPITVGGSTVLLEPRIIWLMVITVAGIGIGNYALVTAYGSRGLAITGFFGGLASSTAVVGTVLDYVRSRPEARAYGVAAILLADGAMATRNVAIALAFTLPDRPLLPLLAPLGTIVVVAIVIAWVTADWTEGHELRLTNPFSLRSALGFGAAFLLVVLGGTLAQAEFGELGLYVTASLSGMVSSAGATTTAVVLYRSGAVSAGAAIHAILLATVASIVVKAGLTVAVADAWFVRSVATRSVLLVVLGGAVGLLVV